MPSPSIASWLVSLEARALLTRLRRIKPFALQETMLPAAALTTAAQTAIEYYLANGRRRLRRELDSFLRWLDSAEGAAASPASIQRRYAILRLKFNVVLSQLDLFSEALAQRSEHDHGIWLAGLDVAAADGLQLPRIDFAAPPVVCYLARGLGGAIRRAHTRLPGGGNNPVALILIPRERMVGAGIASSLFHEVGHQAAALLGLLPSLRSALHDHARRYATGRVAWQLFERWISEIFADLWALAKVGIVSTVGLISTLTLPRRFVFRFSVEDPHPVPALRVSLSCLMGNALYPHPQWAELAESWREYYPDRGLDPGLRGLYDVVRRELPLLAAFLLSHRPPSLAGRTLGDVLPMAGRDPRRLGELARRWHADTAGLRRAPPSLTFAVIGQARFDGRISPEQESQLIADLLAYWALRGTVDAAALASTALARRAPTFALAG
jgi:hypothetical protein